MCREARGDASAADVMQFCVGWMPIGEACDGVPVGGAIPVSRAASTGPGEEWQQQVSDALGAHEWSCGEQRLPARLAAVQPTVESATAVVSQRLRPRVTRSLMDMMSSA
jgi:hypothetical protein